MTDLSPAAQAVLDAFLDTPVDAGNYYATRRHQIASALEVLADQLAYGHGSWAGKSAIIDEDEVLAIATELRSGSQPS